MLSLYGGIKWRYGNLGYGSVPLNGIIIYISIMNSTKSKKFWKQNKDVHISIWQFDCRSIFLHHSNYLSIFHIYTNFVRVFMWIIFLQTVTVFPSSLWFCTFVLYTIYIGHNIAIYVEVLFFYVLPDDETII